MNELWAVALMVVAHAALLPWAYRRGVEHAADAMLERAEGEVQGLREAAERVKR